MFFSEHLSSSGSLPMGEGGGRGRIPYVFNFVSIQAPDIFWNVSSDSIPLAMPRTTKILVFDGL